MNASSNNIEIAVWGLKLGHQIFFSSNGLNTASNDVTDVLEDIRGVVNFSTPGICFHSVELSEKYQIFSVYRTIYDWVGREGYFAISLFVPHGRELPPGRCYTLLQELLNLYERNYIDDRNKIVNYKEDVTLFTRILDEKGKLQPASSGTVVGSGNRYAQVRYTGTGDLIAFLDSPCRSEYAEFKEIFFINEAETRLRLSHNVVSLNITPVVRTLKFGVQANDGFGTTSVRPAILTYKCNGQYVQPMIGSDGLQATIGNLKPGDRISAFQKLDSALEEIGSVVVGNETSSVTTFEVKKTTVRLQISMDSDRADAYPFKIMIYGGGSNAGQYGQALVKNPVSGIIEFTMTLGHSFELTCDKIPNFNFKNSPNVAGFNHGNGTVNLSVRVPGVNQTPVAGQASAYTASQQIPNRSYTSYQDRNTTKSPVSGKVTNGSKILNNNQLKAGVIVILFLVLMVLVFNFFNNDDGNKNSEPEFSSCVKEIRTSLAQKNISLSKLNSYLVCLDSAKAHNMDVESLKDSINRVNTAYKKIETLKIDKEKFDLTNRKPALPDSSEVRKYESVVKTVDSSYSIGNDIIEELKLLDSLSLKVMAYNLVKNSTDLKTVQRNKKFLDDFRKLNQMKINTYLTENQINSIPR